MELRHLRTIAAVARHGSFTKAAEELHLAQSAISQQIRRLEHELGVEVFRRTSRKVELTAEGRVILGYAQRVLARGRRPALRARGAHRPAARPAAHRRRVPDRPVRPRSACSPTSAPRTPASRSTWSRTRRTACSPRCAPTSSTARSPPLDPDALGDEFAATLLWEEEFVVALPVGHPLCARDHVTLRASSPART